jgi:hypothetical protein
VILIILENYYVVNLLNAQVIGPTWVMYVKATLTALFNQLPEVWLVGLDFWFHLTHMSTFPVVTGLAGSCRIFPSGLAALAYRMYVV